MSYPDPKIKKDFLLDPDIVFLNHGSFGATPKPVFDAYQAWQKRLEMQPVEFLGRKANDLLREARTALAGYLCTKADNLVYVSNVTVALNIAARSIQLGSGDEVLATNMEYGAIDRTWRFLAQKQGFKYINQPISVPVTNRTDLMDELWRSVTHRTKVIFVSHISSPTGIIFPVKEICQRAKQSGIMTVIDGAHAPGQMDVNLDEIGADFYGGNCHKWLCAPKGSGFLYVAPTVQHMVEPLVVSWGWQSELPGPSQFIDYLEWSGTRDISAFLSVPAAIQYQQEHAWDQVRTYCHSLAHEAFNQISSLSGKSPLYPDSTEWFSQMGVSRLPDNIDPLKLHDQLWNDFRIEIPILAWNGIKLIRFSFQAYNSIEDLHFLTSALEKLIF